MNDKFSHRLQELKYEAEQDIAPVVATVNKTVEYNTAKVLTAFRHHKVSDFHLKTSTGYGYNDLSREILECLYADIMNSERALVRTQIVSGTHAIALALFGILRPGDDLVAATGAPYDTLEEIIGHKRPAAGSLKEFGVGYHEVDLLPDGQINFTALRHSITAKTKMVIIQRSKGYSLRNSLSVEQIAEVIHFVHSIRNSIVCFVDNCYGEFVTISEPTDFGADLMAGSLIKNPGGGLAPAGGYLVGKQEYIELAATRLTAPGIGSEVGATLADARLLYQGLFLAPTIVGQAIQGAAFAARLFEKLGFRCYPRYNEPRHDIIQAIELNSPQAMVTFCQGLQAFSPIDSHVRPEPAAMPGYADQVVMAGGTFVQGATIELGADGPLRPPYAVYLQGGLSYAHVKIGVAGAASLLIERDLLP